MFKHKKSVEKYPAFPDSQRDISPNSFNSKLFDKSVLNNKLKNLKLTNQSSQALANLRPSLAQSKARMLNIQCK